MIIKHKKWRKYSPEIEQYCKIECPKVFINKENGQAFCYGSWETEEGFVCANGVECSKTINFCLQHICAF